MTDVTATSGAEGTQETQTPESVNTPSTPETPAAPAAETPAAPAAETPVAPSWRDDWRQAMSKGDNKELTRLSRFASPEALFDAYRSLETKLSSQKPTPTLPQNATPEQLTEYRKAVGVPTEAAGYYDHLPEGLVIGEEDKPAMDMLIERLHAKNASPDIVADVVDTYYQIVEANQAEMIEAQKALKQESADALRAEWGADYRGNVNAINAMLDGMDPEVRDLVEGMQLADGSFAFNHAGFMRWMSSLALQINPAALVLPGQSGGDKMETLKGQITANLAEMKKNINAWQSPANASRREEHMRLLDAADRFGLKF